MIELRLYLQDFVVSPKLVPLKLVISFPIMLDYRRARRIAFWANNGAATYCPWRKARTSNV